MCRERKYGKLAKTVTHFPICCTKEKDAVSIAKQPPRQTHNRVKSIIARLAHDVKRGDSP